MAGLTSSTAETRSAPSSSETPGSGSLASSLASLPPTERARLIQTLSDAEALGLLYDWRFWARPKQLPPDGDWFCWVLRAGRGFGKTRAGAGYVHERAMLQPRWIAMVAKTPADARDYMIEGPGGLLRNTPPDERPLYEPSKRRLTWPNGSWATVYSAEDPDQLRGFSGDTFWLDEFAKWPNPRQCWDNLMFGMREKSGDRPRGVIATTPRPVLILQEIEAMATTVTVTGSSYENRENLDERWFSETLAAYEETSFGRQEIHAEYIEQIEDAVIPMAWVEEARQRAAKSGGLRVAGLDVARFGRDATAFAVTEDTHVYALDQWRDADLMETVGRAVKLAEHHGIKALAVDDTGIGGGVSDRLAEMALPFEVIAVNFGASADNKRQFHNKASEMWWRLRETLSPESPLPLSLPGSHPLVHRLASQLIQARHRPDSLGRIWVDKHGFGERWTVEDGSPESPDLADALALALEAWSLHVDGVAEDRPRVYHRASFLGG